MSKENKALVIVESPAKAKTIKNYLGKDYTVKASVGHVIDLPTDSLGVDVEKNFKATYVVMKGKNKVLNELVKAASDVSSVYLAPDPDREGEAIAKHIYDHLKKKYKDLGIYRILVNEITAKGIKKAISNPLAIDSNKFEAQQTRRILDRLVGYQISPILWKKVRRGLSAGRVQSVAVRIIVERENEINAFIPKEYWLIEGVFEVNDFKIKTKLFKINNEKFEIENELNAQKIVNEIYKAKISISNVEKKERKRNPMPPFTTSKLQQDAARKLRFTSKKTMSVAQNLYEGVDLGEEGTLGLITYMRTDSVRVSDDAISACRTYIKNEYGDKYLPEEVRVYKVKKSAQDAHEAIRPTELSLAPEKIKQYLNEDQFKLYSLIWKRFIASQMSSSVYNMTTIDFLASHENNYILRANGSTLLFDGYEKLYLEHREDDDNDDLNILPECNKNDKAKLLELLPLQKFTQAPPRFNEATIVKELEEKGIGRPSTYSSIISTIQDRNYVEKNQTGQFLPTELGFLITELLIDSFPEILDLEFTASMEEKLDSIEEGEINSKKVLKDFYKTFEPALKNATKNMRNIKKEETPTSIKCSECSNIMNIKWGKNGKFLACSNYPECKNTCNYTEDENGIIRVAEEEKSKELCPKCNSPMLVKEGRFGKFLACSKYPECKTTKSIVLGIKCPLCKTGEIAEKRTKKGKAFYGCSNYPTCDFASWDFPVKRKCKSCGFSLMTEKTNKFVCLNKECASVENK